MYKEKIESYFDKNREQILHDIARLCKIRSVKEDALPGMPYGAGPAAALAEALKLMQEMGFATKNYDNYVGVADFNDKPTELAILAHLDVVHEGKGWTVTEPYSPKEVDGKYYGRGTADDKGPAVVALYALKAVKDLGIDLKKNVRLILGCDEECGSSDLEHYFAIEKAPPMSFSPDSSYPVTNIEKGGLSTDFTADWAESKALPRVVSVEGGNAGNIVPQEATAVVEGLTKAQAEAVCKAVAEKTGIKFEITEQENALQILAVGKNAHASTPEHGNSAVTGMIEALCKMPMAECPGFEKLNAVRELLPHGETDGKALGVAMCDEISGPLTVNMGIFKYTLTGLKGNIDSRTPICANESNMSQVVEKTMNAKGIKLETTHMREVHHTSADSPLVKTLLKVYEEYTGREGSCVAIGGGTYVHHIEGGVAFGCSMPETENNMHGPDEFAVIDELMVSGKIFAQAIIDICG